MLIGWNRGHFSLIKRAWLLDADWLSTPALNWFPASIGVWKGISETHHFWVWSQHGHFILTWKKINTQQSAVFWWKSKRIFPTKNVLIRSVKTVWVGTAGVERSTRQNFVASKLKVNFVLLRVACLGHLIGVKKQRKFCRYVTCSQWKEQFWIQEVICARLDTCLRLSTIDEVVSRRCKLRNRKTGE